MADPTPTPDPAPKAETVAPRENGNILNIRELAARPDAEKPANIPMKEWRRHRQAHGLMVVIRSHFKSIYLIPMTVISLVLGIFSAFLGAESTAAAATLGLIWVCCFAFYMNIFIFEWSRPWTYGLLVSFACLFLIGVAFNNEESFPVWKTLQAFLANLKIQFSQQSYFFFAIFFGLCASVSFLRTRLNYVVMESNEIQIFRNALFGDRERVSMLNPRVEVRVVDMLEYFHPFYRAGQIIIHAPDRTIVLDNVLHIRRIERMTDKLGSSFQVRIAER